MSIIAYDPARAMGLPTAPVRADVVGSSAGLLPCAYRHLAIAAAELARAGRVSPQQGARYAAVEARCRSLTDDPSVPLPGPAVAVEHGPPVPLADLLGEAWWRHRWSIPERGVHREMVQAAEQLLQELAWHIPG